MTPAEGSRREVEISPDHAAQAANAARSRRSGPSAAAPAGFAAESVIGQDDFDSSGENRRRAVAADTLCWPLRHPPPPAGRPACGWRWPTRATIA